MIKSKIYAAYLPQYYETEINNKFWGKGFTDWVAVKKSVPLYRNHEQPRVPLNNNYYDLSNVQNIRWQVDLANQYGIDGFNIYHYWFKNGFSTLDKPAKLILENKDIDISFFLTWDNTSWIRSWSNIEGNSWAPKYDKKNIDGQEILLELDYGDIKEWTNHFYHLLDYFKDNRYLKINGKPVFGLMKTDNNDNLIKMYKYWNKLAIENGFDGIFVMSGARKINNSRLFDYQFIYQPRFSVFSILAKINSILRKTKIINSELILCNYSTAWNLILFSSFIRKKRKYFFSGFVKYDDSPRRGNKAHIIKNENPELFKKYFNKLYQLSCKNNKEIILLTAWNEWGEGAYLEPDSINKYSFLEKIKEIKDEH